MAAEHVEQAPHAFARATREGNLQALLELFVADIALWTDGGGKALAARNIIRGADRVAGFMVGTMSRAAEPPESTRVQVNGQPGLAVWIAGELTRIYTFDVDAHGRIQAIYGVLNPDKLRFAMERWVDVARRVTHER